MKNDKTITDCDFHKIFFKISDGSYASNMIKFDYEIHEENHEECPYCSITKLNGYEVKNRPSPRKIPRRNFENSRIRNFSCTSGVSSPGSAYEEIVATPNNSMQRYSEYNLVLRILFQIYPWIF